MINVLIVSKNNSYSIKLLNNLCKENVDIRVANISNSIDNMYKFTSVKPFDVILIDLPLLLSNTMDIFLENFVKKYKKSIILLNDKSELLNNYSNLNYIYKNDFEKIVNKILKIYAYKTQSELIKNKIKKELNYLGYKPNHFGTKYLLEVIYIMHSNNLEGNLAKIIYPHIAKLHKKSANTIKCNIVNATALMYCECPEDKFNNYFGKYTLSRFGPKTVIYTILNKLSS